MALQEVFQEISAADFFYRNRDIAGFTNPTRAIYSTIRELVENSLDACETRQFPPDIYLRISHESGPTDGPGVYRIHIEDNGIGIPINQKDRIFARGTGKNTGFGLFFAREILSITGIEITEDGEPEKGARFVIKVPSGKVRFTAS